ncbi:MAG: hypothetical protein KZY51_04580 [Staphylococcaceae bacterium]|nr:hypothetical protein [Staphylococcaceae bacterium]MBW4842587.1 hypothetical protein [Staphylococcaceae bacterium]
MESKIILKNHILFMLLFFLIVITIYLSIGFNKYYFLVLAALILMFLSLYFSFKLVTENKKKRFKYGFLLIFPSTFMYILLIEFINISLTIINLKSVVFVFFLILANLLIMLSIFQIFNNWIHYVKKQRNTEDKELILIKDSYSLLSLILTLVIPIINLGFSKGEELSASDTLSYIGIVIGGSLICHLLEYIHKHHYKVKKCIKLIRTKRSFKDE